MFKYLLTWVRVMSACVRSLPSRMRLSLDVLPLVAAVLLLDWTFCSPHGRSEHKKSDGHEAPSGITCERMVAVRLTPPKLHAKLRLLETACLPSPLHPACGPMLYPACDPMLHPACDLMFYPACDPNSYPTCDPMLYPAYDPMLYPACDPVFYPTCDPMLYPAYDLMLYPACDPMFYPACDPMFFTPCL